MYKDGRDVLEMKKIDELMARRRRRKAVSERRTLAWIFSLQWRITRKRSLS